MRQGETTVAEDRARTGGTPTGVSGATSLAEAVLWTAALVLGGWWLSAQAAAVWTDRARHGALEAPRADAEPVVADIAPSVEVPFAWPVLEPGATVGRIVIPRVDIDALILEGDEEAVLSRAVGHLGDTALPGQGGTVALAGHRDSFFQPLEHIAIGDRIVLQTPAGDLRYRVAATRIVAPTALDVLADRGREHLTLITCYPFRYIGPAPQRFIVDAEPVP